MAKTFNYWRELHKARLEAEEVFRIKQIELLKQQIELDSDSKFVDELVGALSVIQRIGRKLDQMADEDSMELEDEDHDQSI